MRRLLLFCSLALCGAPVLAAQQVVHGKVVHACGTQTIASSGANPTSPVLIDSTGNVCTNGTFTGSVSGGTHDSVFSWQAPDTAKVRPIQKAGDTLTVRAVQRAGDSLVVKGLSGSNGGTHDTIFSWQAPDTAKVRAMQTTADTFRVRPVQRSGDTLTVKGSFTASAGTHDTIFSWQAPDTANVRAMQTTADTFRVRPVQRSGDTLVVKGSSGNPAGGRLDSLGLAYVKNAANDTLKARITASAIHSSLGTDSINVVRAGKMLSLAADSAYAKLTGQVLSKTRDTATVVRSGQVLSLPTDTVSAKLIAGGATVKDSIFSWFGSTAPTVGSKTGANSIPVVIASDQGAVATTGGAGDSVQLRTGTKHAARVAVDSIFAGATHIGAVNIDTTQQDMSHADSCVSAQGAKTAADSIRLPAVASKRHYVTFLAISLADTLQLSPTGAAAYASLTTSNFPSFGTQMGTALALGAQANYGGPFTWPIKSITANTVTQFKMPAPPAGGYWNITACYFLGP